MIISFNNFKGGTGRTSSVFAAGEILARDKKVLMVDLDFQSSLTYLSGVKVGKTIVDVLGGSSLNEAIYQVSENLFILPSGPKLAEIKLKSPRELQKLLAPAVSVSDYILLDYPPALNSITAAGLVASDWVVVCARPTMLDMVGMNLLLNTVNQAKSLNPGLKVAGVLLTFVDTRSHSMNQVIDEIDLPVLGKIGVSVRVAEAVGKSIIGYSPSHLRSIEYMEFITNLLEVINDRTI